jgi:hypothetical protein
VKVPNGSRTTVVFWRASGIFLAVIYLQDI